MADAVDSYRRGRAKIPVRHRDYIKKIWWFLGRANQPALRRPEPAEEAKHGSTVSRAYGNTTNRRWSQGEIDTLSNLLM